MQTLTISCYDDLTADQWRRVAATARRQVRRITGKANEIGIGRRRRGGRPVGTDIAIRVYLPNKRLRVAATRRVPETLRIRLRRDDGCFLQLELPSDVDSLADYVPTAGRVVLDNRTATAAFLIRWNESSNVVRWGFATVGHLFDRVPLRSATVQVGSMLFRCRKLPSPRGRRNDLCVLAIQDRSDRIAERLLDAGAIQSRRPPATELMNVVDVHAAAIKRRRGRSDSHLGTTAFVGEEVFPNGFHLSGRRLDDCIRVASPSADAFSPGTSGAIWSFQNRAACIQVAGRSPEFREGIGQPFERYLPAITRALGESAMVIAMLTPANKARSNRTQASPALALQFGFSPAGATPPAGRPV